MLDAVGEDSDWLHSRVYRDVAHLIEPDFSVAPDDRGNNFRGRHHPNPGLHFSGNAEALEQISGKDGAGVANGWILVGDGSGRHQSLPESVHGADVGLDCAFPHEDTNADLSNRGMALGPYLPLRNQVGQCSVRYDHQISFFAIL